MSYAINIAACGNISYAGSYILTTDIVNASGDCLSVLASNVIIDCNNYTIASSATGIAQGTSGSSYSNMTIKNCRQIWAATGISMPNYYTYSYGCGVGLPYPFSRGNWIYNNTINATGTGIISTCTIGMIVENNTIISGSGYGLDDNAGDGTYYSSERNTYINNSVISPYGAFRSRYSGGAIVNHSSFTSIGGVGIYLDTGQAYVDYSIVNASYGGYGGGTPIINHSTIYVSVFGFRGSWSGAVIMDNSQIIASGVGKCSDNYGIWSSSYFYNSNLTSVDSVCIQSGNIYGGYNPPVYVNRSYIFSNGSNAIEIGRNWGAALTYVDNSIISSNATNKSAVYNNAGARFFNDTISSKSVDIEDYDHSSLSFRNITFNGSSHPTTATILDPISISSYAYNYSSGSLPFVYSNDSGLYMNISAPLLYGLNITLYYVNDTYDNANWSIYRWDGVALENVSSGSNTSWQDKNITGNYITFRAKMQNNAYNTFALLSSNGLITNYTNISSNYSCTNYTHSFNYQNHSGDISAANHNMTFSNFNISSVINSSMLIYAVKVYLNGSREAGSGSVYHNISVSSDGGASWAAYQYDGYTAWHIYKLFDFTAYTSWTPLKLSDANFKVIDMDWENQSGDTSLYFGSLYANISYTDCILIAQPCTYYGNCSIGADCTLDSDCLSGTCYNGKCTDQITVVVDIFAGTAEMVGFLIAIISLAAGAYVGFRIANTLGSIIACIIVLCIFSILPIPLLPWWATIVGIIASVVGAILVMGSGQRQG